MNYTVVSFVFLAPFAGYTFAGLVNNQVHMKLGQRGIAVIGPACHLIPYIILACHPPYPVLVTMFVFIGFGNGLVDSGWSAWLSNLANANEVCGFLHCFYAIGAAVAPIIAEALFNAGSRPWYYYYYVMVSLLPSRLQVL